MKSAEYWKKRFAMMENDRHLQSEDVAKELETHFERARIEIQDDIEKWYYRLAENNDISYRAAKEFLKADELKEFHWSLEEYIKYGKENAINQKWIKELENASAKVHINKLEALKIQTQQAAESVYQKVYGSTKKAMQQSYQDSYYHTAFEIAKGRGIGVQLGTLDKKAVENAVSKPWANDGASFSDRIWTQKEKMIQSLHSELTNCIIRGEHPEQAARLISKKLDVGTYQAKRLVYTESAALASSAQKDCLINLGVEKYQIVATLDNRTSDICQELDGKVFDMKDYQEGVTAPPFHPCCRSTTCPYDEEDIKDIAQRAARDEDGEVYYVPDDMTYQEWKKAFVDRETEAVHIIKNSKKEIRNRTIEEINNSGTDELLNSYDDRRKHFELNETPADELREKTYNPITVNYNGISIESARAFNETITDLSKEYYTGFTKIEVGDKKKYFGVKKFATTIHQNSVGQKTLVLNPHKVGDYNKMSGRIRELSDKGYCVKIVDGMEEKYIATHEFAHSLIDMEQSLKNYVGYDTKQFKRIRKEIKSTFDEYKTEVKSLEAAYRNKEMEFITVSAEDMTKARKEALELKEKLDDVKISQYSMNNADEFMAEAFAQDKLGVSHSKYSDRVMDILDRNFKKDFAKDDMAYMSNSFRPRYGVEKQVQIDKINMNLKQVSNSSFDMLADTDDPKNKAVRLTEKMFKDIQKELPETFEMPQIAVVDFEKQGLNNNAIGGYLQSPGMLFINSKYDTKQKILDFVNRMQGEFANNTEYAPYLHELGHKFYYDSIKRLANEKKMSYSKAKNKIDYKVYRYIESKNDDRFLEKNISRYADTQEVTEICAESFSVRENNKVAKVILDLIGGDDWQ